jgi:hypothetical protein
MISKLDVVHRWQFKSGYNIECISELILALLTVPCATCRYVKFRITKAYVSSDYSNFSEDIRLLCELRLQ